MTLWTPENTEICKAMFYEGKSAREIGNYFGLSRNAACGKLSRLGLFRKTDKPKPVQAKPVILKPRIRITSANTNSNGMRISITHQPGSLANLREVDVVPLKVPLFDLEDHHCRYPDGEPITFCGHPKTEGSSYCRGHDFLCNRPT